MKHPKHNLLNAAYMFYYATDVAFSPSSSSAHSDVDGNAGESSVAAVSTGGEDAKTKKKLETRLNALTADLLVIAKQVRFNTSFLFRTHSFFFLFYLGWFRCLQRTDVTRQQHVLARTKGESTTHYFRTPMALAIQYCPFTSIDEPFS